MWDQARLQDRLPGPEGLVANPNVQPVAKSWIWYKLFKMLSSWKSITTLRFTLEKGLSTSSMRRQSRLAAKSIQTSWEKHPWQVTPSNWKLHPITSWLPSNRSPFPNKKPLLSTTTIAVPNQFQKTPGSYTKCRRDPCILSLTPGHCIYWQQEETRCANNAGNICNLPDIFKTSSIHTFQAASSEIPWSRRKGPPMGNYCCMDFKCSTQPDGKLNSNSGRKAGKWSTDPKGKPQSGKFSFLFGSFKTHGAEVHLFETHFFPTKTKSVLTSINFSRLTANVIFLTLQVWPIGLEVEWIFNKPVSPMVTGCRNHVLQSFFIHILPFKSKQPTKTRLPTSLPDISWLPPLACSLEYFYSATWIPTRKSFLTSLIHWKAMV